MLRPAAAHSTRRFAAFGVFPPAWATTWTPERDRVAGGELPDRADDPRYRDMAASA